MCHWDTPYRTRRGPDGDEIPTTRRDMADIKGGDAPKLSVPLEYHHYLNWFRELDENYRMLFDGGMHPIGPWLSMWERDSGHLLGRGDRRILLAIDAAYRGGMAKVRADYMRHEQQKQDRS